MTLNPHSAKVICNVRTLLGHSHVDLAIHCLSSALRLSADPVQLVMHEDGSLTPEDRTKLYNELPGSRIFTRSAADEIMEDRLAGYPNALSYRRESVWGLKLFDVVLAEPGNCFYIDCDIRFFRPFRGLFTDSATRGRCVFLRDTVWQGYSIRPWHLFKTSQLQVASGINTGMTLCDQQVFDLDFVDWFLGHLGWRVIPGWIEPTCWAALALRSHGHAVDPEQLTNLYPSARITDKTFGGHFLSSYRAKWTDLLHRPLQDVTASPQDTRFQPLKALSASSLALNQLKRKIQNTF